MNEFQIRSLFENRFGDTPESFGLAVESTEIGTLLTKDTHTLSLRVVNGQQAGWHFDGLLLIDTPPTAPVLKPQDPARMTNGTALRAALA